MNENVQQILEWLGEDPGKARQTDSERVKQIARGMRPTTHRVRLLKHIAWSGPECDRKAGLGAGIRESHNNASTRISELIKLGLLEEVGTVVDHGHVVRTCGLTKLGEAVLEEIQRNEH